MEYLQSTTTAAAKSLVLTYNERTHIFTINAMMRFIASLAPAAELQGKSSSDSAQVDGWVSFGWNSFEVPLEVLAMGVDSVRADMAKSLETLDDYLADNIYMVGDNITLADISLVIVLHKAVSSRALEINQAANVSRWCDTVTQEKFVQTALTSHATDGTVFGGCRCGHQR